MLGLIRSRTIVLAWLAVSVAGLGALAVYEHRCGEQHQAPSQWPDTDLRRRRNGFTLVICLHPQCPCSRATLEELKVILTRCHNLEAQLLFVKPEQMSEAMLKSDLWACAAQLPRTTAVVDRNGKLSEAFHAASSGQCYLYNVDGQLVFSGGITSSRGHVGDNAGADAIIDLARQVARSSEHAPVFGCPLFERVSIAEKQKVDQ